MGRICAHAGWLAVFFALVCCAVDGGDGTELVFTGACCALVVVERGMNGFLWGSNHGPSGLVQVVFDSQHSVNAVFFRAGRSSIGTAVALAVATCAPDHASSLGNDCADLLADWRRRSLHVSSQSTGGKVQGYGGCSAAGAALVVGGLGFLDRCRGSSWFVRKSWLMRVLHTPCC